MTNISKSFERRVDYAEQAIMRKEDSRERDNCYEMHDGAFVVTALVRRARAKPELKTMIELMFSNFDGFENIPWIATADKYADIPTERLTIAAAQCRKKAKADFAEYMARGFEKGPEQLSMGF